MPNPANSPPITLADDGRDPWDRQPGEGLRQHGYFEEFRKLGPGRDLKRTAEKVSKSHSYLLRLASRFRWTERAAAWDRHDTAKWHTALVQFRRRAAQEHLRLSQEFYQRAMASIQAMAQQNRQLNPTELVRVADTYSRLVRYALGEPDTNVGISGGPPTAGPVEFTHVPPDEAALRRELESAVAELARKHATTGEVDPYDVLDLPE